MDKQSSMKKRNGVERAASDSPLGFVASGGCAIDWLARVCWARGNVSIENYLVRARRFGALRKFLPA
jgi:hypothetical protein